MGRRSIPGSRILITGASQGIGRALAELAAEPKFKNLVVFEVDFDNQKDAVRAFNAQSQSTLIVFKGEMEIGRSVGDTHQKSIAALLASAL